ncbi:hypothetical protein CFRS1_v007079 [Colletotrichum fructicola]|nr:hypothetical protein CFRS1_v007079 [Colletotrichum fructicola]
MCDDGNVDSNSEQRFYGMPTQRRTQDLALSEKPLAQSSEGLGDASDPKFCARGGGGEQEQLTLATFDAVHYTSQQSLRHSVRPDGATKPLLLDTAPGENLGVHYQNKALCRRPTQKSGTPS